MYFSAIFARSADKTPLFGVKDETGFGRLPWGRCDADMAWFRQHTAGGTVIMGRGTWNSLGLFKPLKDRQNIVVSSHPLDTKRKKHVMSVEEPLFSMICRGEKKVDGRLNNSLERASITAGDTIQFEKTGDPKAFCVCAVTKVSKYSGIRKMIEEEGAEALLPGLKSISGVDDALQFYRRFYTEDAEAKADGALAIHLAHEESANYPGGIVWRVASLTDALRIATPSKKRPPPSGGDTKSNQKHTKVASGAAAMDVKEMAKMDGRGGVFVIGGVDLLWEAFRHPCLEQIFETRIQMGPTVFSSNDRLLHFSEPIPRDYAMVFEEDEGANVFRIWSRRRENVEGTYLALAQKVLDKGVREVDRTGVGTISTFGEQFRYDLADGFPMLTTKRVFWKGVVEELLWFLRGETNVKSLQSAGVHIWDANLESDHTKKLGLPQGELGPVYGRQWRAFGPEAGGIVGVDQIKRVIDDIRKSPNSRRLIVSAWNPMVVDKVALPSCHCFFQFEVKAGKLSCLVYLRSNDLFLGAPWNIASYGLLTHIIAEMTGLQPGEIVYSVGNAHIYLNHIEQMREQLKRPTRMLPKLEMDKAVIAAVYPPNLAATGSGPVFSILKLNHFNLFHYHPHAVIKGEMAV